MTISSTKTLNWYLLMSVTLRLSSGLERAWHGSYTKHEPEQKPSAGERSALSSGAAGERWCCAWGSRPPDTARLQHQGLPAVRARGGRAGSIAAGAAAVPSPGRHPPAVQYSHTAQAAARQRWGCVCARTCHVSSSPSPHKEGNIPLQGAVPGAEHPIQQAGTIGESSPAAP